MFTSYKRILNYSLTKAQISKGNKKQILNKQNRISSGIFIFLPEGEARELIKCIQSVIQGIPFNGFTWLSVLKFIFEGYLSLRGDGDLKVLEEHLELHTSIPRTSVLHPQCLHTLPTAYSSVPNLTSESEISWTEILWDMEETTL